MGLESFSKSESISSEKFYEELIKIDFTKEGPRLRVYNVDLNLEIFTELLNGSKTLTPIASSDGIISHVRETPDADSFDYSQSSRYFRLHTDGQYMPAVPEIVILHCADPGTSEIPTIFADTKDILEVLRVTNRLEAAQEYEFVFRNRKGLDFVRPLIETRLESGELVMNVAIASPQCHLRPLRGSNKTQKEADKFYKLLEEIAEQSLKVIPHVWKKNDAVVFDNLRLIHGRGLPEQEHSEISDVQRHLHRIWLSQNKLASTFSYSKKELMIAQPFSESIIEIEKSIEISPVLSSNLAICLIKPDAYQYKDEIKKRIENAGLGIIHKTSHKLSDRFIEKLYEGVTEKKIIGATVRHFHEGLSEILLVKGDPEMLTKLLNTVGLKTNPALCSPDSIRFIYGNHVPEELEKGLLYYKNAVHRPTNRLEADRDLNLFKNAT